MELLISRPDQWNIISMVEWSVNISIQEDILNPTISTLISKKRLIMGIGIGWPLERAV